MIFCEIPPPLEAFAETVKDRRVVLMATDDEELGFYARSLDLPSDALRPDSFGIPRYDVRGKPLDIVLRDDRVVKLERPEFVKQLRLKYFDVLQRLAGKC